MANKLLGLQFAETRSRWGLGHAVYEALMESIGRVFNFHIARFNVRPLTSDSNAALVTPVGYVVRMLDQSDLAQAVNEPELDISAEFVAKTCSVGGYCVGAFSAGELVAYVWRAISTTQIDENFELDFPKPLRYGYKALTLPEHRGKHLQMPISLFSDRYDIGKGYTSALSFIETHNYASLISDARRGNRYVGWMCWIGGLRWCYTSASARRLGLRIRLRHR